MFKIDLTKNIDIEEKENAEEGLGTNAAIFAATFAAGKGISGKLKNMKNESQRRKNIKEDDREKETRDYYDTPEGRKELRELREKARVEAKELNHYLSLSRKSTEGFGCDSITLAEEGILSKLFNKDKERRKTLKNTKYLEEFQDQKESLIATTSKKIEELEREDERLNTLMKDEDSKCFNAIIKMHSSLISLLSKQIEKLEAIEFENKDSIDDLNEIFDKFNKDEKYESTMKLIKKEYPKSFDRAKRIFNMSEDSYNKELNKHVTLTKLTEDETAEESVFNLGIAKPMNNDYKDIYYTILSKDYNKSKHLLSQFFGGKKTYEIPKYILRNIVDIKNQFFPTIGRAINDALDTYERTKPLLNKERSFIYKKPETDRDAKIVQRFQANIDLIKSRKESYKLDTIDEFISSKTGNYEDHRYDEETIKVDANYLKTLLQVDETIKIMKKLTEINKELPNLEEYSVLAKYSKEIAKYTNLEVFNSDDVKAPIHAYYNYITEFTLFMQFIEKTLISYVAAIYEVLNYTTIK